MTSRRKFVQQVAALGTLSAASAIGPTLARAQAAKLRVGLMLPYTGTFAALTDGSSAIPRTGRFGKTALLPVTFTQFACA